MAQLIRKTVEMFERLASESRRWSAQFARVLKCNNRLLDELQQATEDRARLTAMLHKQTEDQELIALRNQLIAIKEQLCEEGRRNVILTAKAASRAIEMVDVRNVLDKYRETPTDKLTWETALGMLDALVLLTDELRPVEDRMLTPEQFRSSKERWLWMLGIDVQPRYRKPMKCKRAPSPIPIPDQEAASRKMWAEMAGLALPSEPDATSANGTSQSANHEPQLERPLQLRFERSE